MAFEPIIKLTGHRAAVYALADKDTQYFLSFGGDGYVVEWSKSGEIHDGKLVANADSPLYCGLFEKSDNLIVTGGLNGTLYWVDDVHKKVVSAVHGHNKGIFALQLFRKHT
ncbi:MAG: hypothetical protein IPN29_06175 [Saprospiraceae bacterium]|nr:hypothetical protein [Saprospiraceae bacterium]